MGEERGGRGATGERCGAAAAGVSGGRACSSGRLAEVANKQGEAEAEHLRRHDEAAAAAAAAAVRREVEGEEVPEEPARNDASAVTLALQVFVRVCVLCVRGWVLRRHPCDA
jgi:hypothetical protein